MGLLHGNDSPLWQLSRRQLGGKGASSTTDPSSALIPGLLGGGRPGLGGGPPPPPGQQRKPPGNGGTTSSTSTTVITTSTSVAVITSTPPSLTTSTTSTSMSSSTSSSSSSFFNPNSSSSSTAVITTPVTSTSIVDPSTSISTDIPTTSISSLESASTHDQHGLASVTPTQSSAASTSSTSSSATNGISGSSNSSTGFFVGMGVVIGAGIAIILCMAYYLYKRHRSLTHQPTYSYRSHSRQNSNTQQSIYTADNRPQYRTMSENGYTGVGFTRYPPSVPDTNEKDYHDQSTDYHPFHHHPLPSPPFQQTPIHSYNHRTTIYQNQHQHQHQQQNQSTYSPSTISPGLVKIYAATPPIYTNPNSFAKEKARIVSTPIGSEAVRFERDKELERELERERMGRDWEVARKRGTGAPLGSVGGSDFGEGVGRWS